MRKQGLKKFILSVLIAILSVGVLSGCGAEKNSNSTENKKDAQITEYKKVIISGAGVDSKGNVSLGGNAAIAKDQGFLEEELNAVGYTAEYVGFQTAGVGANEALAAKEADIAIYGDFPAVTYIASGNDAKIFAGDTTSIIHANWRHVSRRINFHSARRRIEAMRWHRRLTTTQQMEI